MDIRKTVITAAGPGQRTLPLQTLVDRDGKTKTALHIIIEEALHSGAEEICVVVHPGDVTAYRTAAGDLGKRLHFVEQTRALGYGHAIWSAHEFTGADPFLLLVGDHLYLSREARSCARQLVETAAAEACTVSAVQATHESKLPYYGTAGGRLAENRQGLYLVSEVLEKPTPTVAEQRLIVPGLRAGHYLCFFGMHVLPPRIMEILGAHISGAPVAQRIQLSPALEELASKEQYCALEVQGRRYDLDEKYGVFTTQLALALAGHEREEVLAQLVALLAQQNLGT